MEPYIRWGPDAHTRTILRAKMGRPRTCPDMSCGRCSQSESAGEASVGLRCGCRLVCTRWGAGWSNLANTNRSCVCGGDAALCQITLTTCPPLNLAIFARLYCAGNLTHGLVSSYFVVLPGYLFIYFLFKEDKGPKAVNLINFVKVMRMG